MVCARRGAKKGAGKKTTLLFIQGNPSKTLFRRLQLSELPIWPAIFPPNPSKGKGRERERERCIPGGDAKYCADQLRYKFKQHTNKHTRAPSVSLGSLILRRQMRSRSIFLLRKRVPIENDMIYFSRYFTFP